MHVKGVRYIYCFAIAFTTASRLMPFVSLNSPLFSFLSSPSSTAFFTNASLDSTMPLSARICPVAPGSVPAGIFTVTSPPAFSAGFVSGCLVSSGLFVSVSLFVSDVLFSSVVFVSAFVSEFVSLFSSDVETSVSFGFESVFSLFSDCFLSILSTSEISFLPVSLSVGLTSSSVLFRQLLCRL